MSEYGEAPPKKYSTVVTLTQGGVEMEVQVTADTPVELLENVAGLHKSSAGMGWQVKKVALPDVPAPAAPAPAPVAPVQPAAPAAPAPVPSTGQGQPPQHEAGALRLESIEGYVIGTYNDRREKTERPCVWLYTANRPFCAYTVYPERFGSVLGWPFQDEQGLVEKAWRGSAPSKDQAKARRMYNPLPIDVPVTPEVGPDGKVVTKNGWTKWRLAPTEWANAHGTQQAQPAQPAQRPASGTVQPIEIVPNHEPYGEDDFFWSMQDRADWASGLSAALPADVREFIADWREHDLGRQSVRTRPATAVQWALLNEYVADVLGIETTDEIKAELAVCSPAGYLVGLLVDRYVRDSGSIAESVVRRILSLVMPTRQGSPNPNYQPYVDKCVRALLSVQYLSLKS